VQFFHFNHIQKPVEKMKKINLLLLAVLQLTFATQLSGQWLFSPPQPFTDSPSHKANASLDYVYGMGWVVMWEQYTDTTSTAIWYKKYLTGDDPGELIAEPGTHFKRPKVIVSWKQTVPQSSLIIFEKVSDGKSQLYSIEIDANGNQSDTIPFWTSGNQNHELTVGMDNYRVAWISDGYLLASHKINNNGVPSFSVPDTVAFGSLRQPSITTTEKAGLYWIEDGDQEDRIMFSEALYPSGWGTPQTIITETEINKKNTRWTYDDLVSWSYKNGEQWQINNYQYQYNYGEFYPLSITSDEPFDFAAWSSYIPLKSQILQMDFYTLAYPKMLDDHKEIFVHEYWGYWESYQLSFLNTDSRNPSFHDGESDGELSSYIYLIWEAEIDGYWQLYNSRFSYNWSNVEEHHPLTEVTISPNPATNQFLIHNQKDLPLVFRVYDAKGNLFYENQSNSSSVTVPVAHWPRGLYLVSLFNGNSHLSKKITLE
jgi:hypothetical protein